MFKRVFNKLVAAQEKRAAYWMLHNMTDRQLKDINTSEIELWFARHSKLAKLKGKTKNDYLVLLRRVFDYGIKKGVITLSPMARIDRFPNEQNNTANPFTRKEVEMILAASVAWESREAMPQRTRTCTTMCNNSFK